MASLTIRNLDEPLKQRLRIRAATHGRSMEDEARNILRATLADGAEPLDNLAQSIRARFAPFGSVDLPIPPRAAMREPPTFDE